MAMTIYALSNAFNEAATGYRPENVEPYQFFNESLSGAFGEANSVVISEAVNVSEFMINSDAVLSEAAILHPDTFAPLQEAVLSGVKERVVGFFKKAMEVVKGLIDKVKAAALRIFKQTDAWAKASEDRINKVPAGASVKVETYEYDTAFMETLTSKGPDIISAWNNELKVADLTKIDGAYSQAIREYHNKKASTANVRTDEGGGAEKYKSEIEKVNHDKDDHKDKFAGVISGIVGVSGDNLGEIRNNAVTKAHGHDGEKVELTITSSEASTMMTAVKSSSKKISDVEKSYTALYKQLESIKRAIENSRRNDSFKADEGGGNSKTITAANEWYKSWCDYAVAVTKDYQSAMSAVMNTAVSLHSEMASEYMGILSKYAGAKPEKA